MPEDVIGKVKPEYVAPIVAWLCSEQCKVSGKMFSAGGGYFSRAAVVEGPGVVFAADQEISIEMILENLDQIMSLENGSEFASAMEQAGTVLSKMAAN
jgi:hypothetical protein